MIKGIKEYLLITCTMWFIYLPPLTIWAIYGLNYSFIQYQNFLWQSVPFDLLTNYPVGKFIIWITKKCKSKGLI